MKESQINPIINNVKDLAAYIKNEYIRAKNRNISPIKLQKSLYFLFAYWGGFIRKSKQEKEKNPDYIESDYSEYSEYLFTSPIEAWVYGPVVPEVYKASESLGAAPADLFNSAEVQEFADDLLDQIFQISDFRLVDISHADKVWRKYFDETEVTHNNIMDMEEIIDEYTLKFEKKQN